MVRTLAFYPNYFNRYRSIANRQAALHLLKRKQKMPSRRSGTLQCGIQRRRHSTRKAGAVTDSISLNGTNAAHRSPPPFRYSSLHPIIAGPTGKSSIFPVFFGNNFSGGRRGVYLPNLTGQREGNLNILEKYPLVFCFYSCNFRLSALQ